MGIFNTQPARFLLALCLGFAAITALPPAAAQETAETGTAADPSLAAHADAVAVVEELHSSLIDVMKNAGSLGYQGRYERLHPVISSLFDTPLICKVILSRYWDDLDDQQKSDFIDLFNKLSTSTYASRFNSYSGEEFRSLGVQELRKGRLLVKTELVRPDDKPVKLDYLVHQDNGKWLIISVIADGVNDLSLKRAEYAVVIKDKGYSGLLEDIKSKIRDMENGK
jgi:phospholipid transport system substrate-binding protein